MDDVDAEAVEPFAHELRRFFCVCLVDFSDRWQVVGIVLVAVRERVDPPVGIFKRFGIVDIDDNLAAAESSIRSSEVSEEGEFIHRVCGVFVVISKDRLLSQTEESGVIGAGLWPNPKKTAKYNAVRELGISI